MAEIRDMGWQRVEEKSLTKEIVLKVTTAVQEFF